jgi:hypothetical protein
MRLPSFSAPSTLPVAGARVPGYVPRAVLFLAGTLLSLVDYGASGWLVVGAALSLVAALWPRYLVGWALILFLAAGRAGSHTGLDWRVLVLIAGVHLVHVLSLLTVQLPPRGWVQPGVFSAPLRRFVAIQIPTQVLAVLALVLLVGHDGHREISTAVFAAVGAVALVGLGLLLFGPRAGDANG